MVANHSVQSIDPERKGTKHHYPEVVLIADIMFIEALASKEEGSGRGFAFVQCSEKALYGSGGGFARFVAQDRSEIIQGTRFLQAMEEIAIEPHLAGVEIDEFGVHVDQKSWELAVKGEITRNLSLHDPVHQFLEQVRRDS